MLQERYGWVQDCFDVSWQVMADPHYQSPAKVKELAEACGFRPGARHGNRFQYSLVLEKPERS